MIPILGIDPGLSGALALLDADDYLGLTIIDAPTLKITTNGKKRRRLDLYFLAGWLDANASAISHVFIEQVGAMPGQGVSSMFKFGEVFGALQGLVAANMIPMTYVTPQRWKKHFGLTADKDAARLHASRLLPQFAHLWTRAKDDGRAEATLIALYGAQTMS